MSQRKYAKTEPLDHLIGVRVSTQFFNKLEGLRMNSNCRSIGEFVRMILLQEKINWYHKDATNDAVTVELIAIRKELKAIGININQVTRYFNGTTIPNQKIVHALKILDEYKKVSVKMDNLLTVLDGILK